MGLDSLTLKNTMFYISIYSFYFHPKRISRNRLKNDKYYISIQTYNIYQTFNKYLNYDYISNA